MDDDMAIPADLVSRLRSADRNGDPEYELTTSSRVIAVHRARTARLPALGREKSRWRRAASIAAGGFALLTALYIILFLGMGLVG